MQEDKFLNVLKRLKWPLHAFFLKRMGGAEGDKALEAKDLVQETAKRALAYIDKPPYSEDLENLVWMIARNVATWYSKKCVRARRLRQSQEGLTEAGESDPIGSFLNNDRRNQFMKTKNISATNKEIFRLRSEGYEYQEIALIVGMNEDTVKMRIQRLKNGNTRR